MSQWTHIQAFSKEADWLCRWMKPRWSWHFVPAVPPVQQEQLNLTWTAPASLCFMVSFIRQIGTNKLVPLHVVIQGLVGHGWRWRPGSLWGRENNPWGEATSVSILEWTSQKAQIFGNNLTLSVDLLVPCSRAIFHPRLPPNFQRCMEVPGAGGLCEGVPGRWVLGRLGWWAAPLAITWLFGACMVMPGDCCWPDKLLSTPWKTLSSSS